VTRSRRGTPLGGELASSSLSAGEDVLSESWAVAIVVVLGRMLQVNSVIMFTHIQVCLGMENQSRFHSRALK